MNYTSLLQKIPQKYVDTLYDGKTEYHNHAMIQQYVMAWLGKVPSSKLIRIVKEPDGFISGAVWQYTFSLPNQEQICIEAVGQVDDPYITPKKGGIETTKIILKGKEEEEIHQHEKRADYNGAALKKTESDAFKKACMRIGFGMELWCKNKNAKYILPQLLKQYDFARSKEVIKERINIFQKTYQDELKLFKKEKLQLLVDDILRSVCNKKNDAVVLCYELFEKTPFNKDGENNLEENDLWALAQQFGKIEDNDRFKASHYAQTQVNIILGK